MIKDTYKFKSDTLNFDLKIESFDCMDYQACLEICLILKPDDSVKKEWIKEFTLLDNLRVSFEMKNGLKTFVPVTKDVLNLFFSKNPHSTAFIFNSVFKYVVDCYKTYNPPEIDEEDEADDGEKKSLIE